MTLLPVGGPSGDGERAGSLLTVIQHTSGWRSLDLKEVWRHHEILYFLVWRDLKARFKQTTMGLLWILLRPVLSIVVFTLVFGKLAKVPSDGLPYSLFVMVAMAPWGFFAAALASGTSSLVANSHLITKVYFPRLILPLSSILSGLVDVVISLVLLVGLMVWYGKVPPWSALLTVPALFALTFALALGLSLLLGALNVRYRDVGNLIPFLLQIWMYATPILYPSSLVPERFRPFVALNPLTGIVDGLRSSLFGTPWNVAAIVSAVTISTAILIVGLYQFRAAERTFADTV